MGSVQATRRHVRVIMVCAAVLACGGWWAASARATDFCEGTPQSCEYQAAQVLFDQLNTDIAAYPPNPCAGSTSECRDVKDTTTRMATQAESLYPPSPARSSDFCPSYGMFGRLANYTQGLLTAYPPVPSFPPSPNLTAVLNDTLAIRSASIWAVVPVIGTPFPPNPCIGG
jgi:hypothetical protein